ncbi:sulfide/dihydroorotate dehydrogenase-like FAD/NAD-binding protein [bacterium]|nr:sulfide/dihydroorotate dehydrogenase-like FAD/NAD-binding protein [bacterium]
MNKIISRTMIVPNIHLLTVESPLVASKIKAGHFVIIKVDETGERIPLTVADWDREMRTVSCVFMQVGRSTRKLALMKNGDEVSTFVGPLGKIMDIHHFGTVACVGGCYGIGSIYPVVRSMKEAENRVISFIEARSRFLLYWEDKIGQISDELVVSTGDGSKGRKGHNSDGLRAMLEKGRSIDLVVAIGCTFMMHMISETTRPFGVKTIVSLNPIMVDGTGMCGACRVEVGGKTKFACVDGPNFDGHEVDWNLLLSRRKVYNRQEMISEKAD